MSKSPHQSPDQLPNISIIIPARNSERTIASTLDSLLAQDYAGEMEVIVADGSETSGTGDIIRKSYPWVRLIPNPKKTLAHGCNAGFRVATGDVIVRCDAHTAFPPGYVSRAVQTLERTGAANVGGRQLAEGETFFERTVAIAMTTLLGVGDSIHRIGGEEGPAKSAFLGVFRRETLDDLDGWYDVSLNRNQDYDLNQRLIKQGKTVWFDPELMAFYKPRSTPRALARQYFDYGRSKLLVTAKHPGSILLRHLAPPAFVLALVAGVGLSLAGFPLPLATLLFVYTLTILGGSVVIGFRRRDMASVLLPLALAIMHLSWGIGFFFPKRA